jgi:hypothetical protein
VFRCLSFYACPSISLFFAASLDLSSNSFTGNIPIEIGNFSNLSECFICVTLSCRSATSSTNNFAVFRRLSFYACPSISLFFAAFLDLSSNSFTGNIPIEIGNLSELSECFNCVTRAYAALQLGARTTSLCSGASHSMPVRLFLSFAQHFWICRATHSPGTLQVKLGC